MTGGLERSHVDSTNTITDCCCEVCCNLAELIYKKVWISPQKLVFSWKISCLFAFWTFLNEIWSLIDVNSLWLEALTWSCFRQSMPLKFVSRNWVVTYPQVSTKASCAFLMEGSLDALNLIVKPSSRDWLTEGWLSIPLTGLKKIREARNTESSLHGYDPQSLLNVLGRCSKRTFKYFVAGRLAIVEMWEDERT